MIVTPALFIFFPFLYDWTSYFKKEESLQWIRLIGYASPCFTHKSPFHLTAAIQKKECIMQAQSYSDEIISQFKYWLFIVNILHMVPLLLATLKTDFLFPYLLILISTSISRY